MAALSTITVQQILDEMSASEEFSGLTDAEQLELINTAQQDVCEIYFQDGRDDYKTNNLLSAVASSGVGYRSGSGVATIAGNPITFSTPLSTNTYSLSLPPGVSYLDPNTNADSRTTDGFTAYAMADGVEFTYIAVDPV